MRIRTHGVRVIAAVVLAIGLATVPAHATVHEIVAQWCSGHDELGPPGISDGEKKNFARPLNAAKVVIQNIDHTLNTVLITFDYGHRAVKVQSSGLVIQIGTVQIGNEPYALLLDIPEPDPNFPAFKHCPALAN